MSKLKLNKKKTVIISVIFSLIIILTVILLISNKALEVNEYSLEFDRLPEDFDGFKIAQISDLHNASFGKDNKRLIEKLSQAQPDIIVITGDLVDSRRTDIETALAFVEEAVKIAPCYYITGNHEARISDFHLLNKGISDLGVTLLRNKSVSLKVGKSEINLVGIDDPLFLSKDKSGYSTEISNMLKEFNTEESFSILLAHRPHFFDIYAARGFDLTLSGHAHGGQIRLPRARGLFAPDQGFFPDYDSGEYTRDSSKMMVSRGIGNSIFPLRVNNPPEIVLIELKKSH